MSMQVQQLVWSLLYDQVNKFWPTLNLNLVKSIRAIILTNFKLKISDYFVENIEGENDTI